MSLIKLDIELTEKNIVKRLGLFILGSLQGFSFCPPKTFKPNKQTLWNTKHLHGIGWSSGKLDYEKLFAVFYDINVVNAEVFAKGLEKCRLLTNILGRKVEKLDDHGCPKVQDLVKTDSLWISLVTLSDTKQDFIVPREKQRCMGNGICNICKFCTCLLYLCLLLVYFFQLDMIFLEHSF